MDIIKDYIVTLEVLDWDAQEYDRWYDDHRAVYLSELEAVRTVLPAFKFAVEIGIGTGRYSSELGIQLGIEPSANMSKIAASRGITVVAGKAEELPFSSSSFEVVLFVTSLCFVDDMDRALVESYRVLKPSSSIVIGFLDFGTILGKELRDTEMNRRFPKRKSFLTSFDLQNKVTNSGFTDIELVQTLFQPLDHITDVEPVQSGYGQGFFVALRALKKVAA